MKALEIRLADVAVRLRCDFAPLADYARVHFGPAAVATPGRAAPTIDVDLRWHEGHPPVDATAAYADTKGCERLDRDLWAGRDRLVWLRIDELRDLHLRFHLRPDGLDVRGDYYHRLSNDRRADRLRRLIYRARLSAFRRKRFTRLLYYLVYYPVFWWQEHRGDAHPLHAAAVETPEGGVLLAGPSGVGKSTLTTALGAGDGARILSDTFVLHRGVRLWAVSEPLLLDRWSVRWLGEAAIALGGVDHGYALGREGYVVPPERFTEGGEARSVVLPRRAPEHYVRRIEPAAAAARIQAYNDIVNDLRRYRAVAAVLELLDPIGIERGRQRNLDELTAAVPCYEMGITPSLTRAEAVSALRATLHDREQSAAIRAGHS